MNTVLHAACVQNSVKRKQGCGEAITVNSGLLSATVESVGPRLREKNRGPKKKRVGDFGNSSIVSGGSHTLVLSLYFAQLY